MSWNFYTASGVEKSGQYLGTGIPVGAIASYSGTSTPSYGWLLCDGSAVNRSSYAELFSVIGTFYGAGDGSSTFNLPDSTGDIIAYTSFAQIANLASVTPPQYVTALPSSPIDGQEIYYQSSLSGSGGAQTMSSSETMASIGAIWHLRYRSSSTSAYKWEFVGGTPVIVNSSDINGDSTQATHTTYQSLSNEITIVPPEKGDYLVILGAECLAPAVTNGAACASYKIGTSAPSDYDRVRVQTSSSSIISSMHREQVKTLSGATSAARTLTAQYKSGTANAATFYSRWIGIQPVRIG